MAPPPRPRSSPARGVSPSGGHSLQQPDHARTLYAFLKYIWCHSPLTASPAASWNRRRRRAKEPRGLSAQNSFRGRTRRLTASGLGRSSKECPRVHKRTGASAAAGGAESASTLGDHTCQRPATCDTQRIP
ncbi:hypothetical protein NDU88_002459 [Pleurodeles waltl]|uniref:Uncharacterized protein n=1 Tax=Pleurodeles waltl TaxID=8319 RepID=A0AAV7UXS1_PLEWA|nr:hypothetical protein NDU88_002459 [Pleurodeles waltl]